MKILRGVLAVIVGYAIFVVSALVLFRKLGIDPHAEPMIWGYGLEFLEDGTGFNRSWGSDVRLEDREVPFVWKRTGEKIIAMRFLDEEEWEYIEYEITDFVGAYDSRYYKITKTDSPTFWCSPEPLYKPKR